MNTIIEFFKVNKVKFYLFLAVFLIGFFIGIVGISQVTFDYIGILGRPFYLSCSTFPSEYTFPDILMFYYPVSFVCINILGYIFVGMLKLYFLSSVISFVSAILLLFYWYFTACLIYLISKKLALIKTYISVKDKIIDFVAGFFLSLVLIFVLANSIITPLNHVFLFAESNLSFLLVILALTLVCIIFGIFYLWKRRKFLLYGYVLGMVFQTITLFWSVFLQ